MSKQDLPVYTINTLQRHTVSHKDFAANYFEQYLEEHKDLRFPHKHSFYHLVYFSAGSGSHSIDFKNFKITAGQVYFMIPGQVHSWHFKTVPTGYIVNFSEQYLQALITDARYLDQFPFFSGIANEQVINIPDEHRVPVTTILQTLVTEGNSVAKLKNDFARTALLQLFITISRLLIEPHGKGTNHYSSLLLRNFQKLIDAHYKEKKLTKEYAAILYVTPNHLNALCKDITGQPAGVLIRERIILEAKRLLVNANMTVTEISHELDFADNSYFSKFFKKHTGVTPEVFRKQFINK